MKIHALIPLASLLILGCATTSTSQKEYKFVEIDGGIGTRVSIDENGETKTIRVNERMRAEEVANRMSRDGWTLLEFEEVPDIKNAPNGGLSSYGTKITLVFSRPPQK